MAVLNVQYLVTSAIFLSVQDAAFQPDINSGYQAFALDQINSILDDWRDYIPFNQEITFDNISDLTSTEFVEVNTVQFVLLTEADNNAAFYLRKASLDEFKRQQVIIGLEAFPGIYYFDQNLQRINIYPLPSQPNYQFVVRGRLAQINLVLTDVIPANMPRFMWDAVIWETAFRLAARYGTQWDAKKETLRNYTYKSLTDKKEIDITPDIHNVFGQPGISYASPFPIWYFVSGGGT